MDCLLVANQYVWEKQCCQCDANDPRREKVSAPSSSSWDESQWDQYLSQRDQISTLLANNFYIRRDLHCHMRIVITIIICVVTRLELFLHWWSIRVLAPDDHSQRSQRSFSTITTIILNDHNSATHLYILHLTIFLDGINGAHLLTHLVKFNSFKISSQSMFPR